MVSHPISFESFLICFLGKAGGALTSNLLKVLYADEQVSNDDLSFVEVLEKVKGDLQRSGYEQIPQFSSLNPIDVNTKFDLLPDSSRGTKRAVMIGINYIGTFYIMERDTCNFIRPTIISSSRFLIYI